MIKLKAKKRTDKNAQDIRTQGIIPAVLYGPEVENLNLQVNLKEFNKVYKKAGESTLISLDIEGLKKEFLVLVHDIQFGSLGEDPIHVDFYQPLLKEETEVEVPIVLEGKSPAVKNLNATLVKNISEIEVKALPRNLPKEIKVNVKGLENFDDMILVKDLQVPEGVKVLREPEEILITVSAPEKLEEEEEEKEEVPLAGEGLKPEIEEKKSPAGQEKQKEENKEDKRNK